MQLKPITVNIEDYPEQLRPYLSGAPIYDSSCSQDAKVFYIEKDSGFFLKISDTGTLKREDKLTRYFCRKGVSAPVLEYVSNEEHDYLLTKKVSGLDCVAMKYLEQPKRLCDTLAEALVMLHSMNHSECPISNHTDLYKSVIEQNYAEARHDMSYCDVPDIISPSEAYQYVKTHFHLLETNTLLHGDYCLPNVILDNWQFSGFVDLGNGGVGDRHVDLFWGAWTLRYNLKTDKYRERFFDAYGRDKIDDERLRLIGACEVFG